MENKQYIYNLPNESNEKQKLETNTNSIIIVGANGSGKSKLGAWMGKNNNHTHIIASKRLTYISENLSIWLETDVQKQDDYTDIKNTQDDYDDTISILFRQQIKELCSRDKNKPFKTRIDYLFEIFNKVTQKELNINKNRFCINSKDKSYDLTNFSRGEELILYLISKILTIPNNEQQIIIIDEPELHLHPSLTNRLWDILEKHRQDCLFIYITHDLNFASSRTNSDKFWIKSYNGEKWEFEQISTNEIMPQELFLKLLGTRRNVLFIEGKNNSLDFKIYSVLYPQYQIITCGSCEKVIQYTKAFNDQSALHGFKAYGIIDRDYRSQNEINALMNKDINVLKVAEVENLFLLECIVLAVLKQSGRENKFEEIKNYLFEEKFKNCLEKQILENLKSEIKHKLNTIDINLKTSDKIKEKINSIEEFINFDDLHKNISNKFNSVYKE
ncbi:AAA family ATPase, partial [Campylobacter coli]|nr:ABC transporter ATP-binding protein [Campylobacter coli]ECO2349036.1 DUF4435 domain-containing protein [Campylobacter jejuni]EHL8412824.1 AAA family ATPase [Campylobacter coli]ELB3249044.1 AAA family ATPase [Campylobacter coli]